mmetsp:Transcript_5139/g.7110  ORF Transcript_5139/g.7110 Transcript_5139/m.7110 type:complete len:626 (-) Transcript_5139:249-2126(-)
MPKPMRFPTLSRNITGIWILGALYMQFCRSFHVSMVLKGGKMAYTRNNMRHILSMSLDTPKYEEEGDEAQEQNEFPVSTDFVPQTMDYVPDTMDYVPNAMDYVPETMDIPDFFPETMGSPVKRELDDILMEKALRFYDPNFVGDREKAFLVGVEVKGLKQKSVIAKEYGAEYEFSLEESLGELTELTATAGMEVVGSTYQRLNEINPRTYVGTGKVAEIKKMMSTHGCKAVIFDDELSPGQQRNLEKEFGGEAAGIKVLDRTALILDIFAQHARTKEGQLQVELALTTYRLPRLTKLWTHLERQSAGGKGSVGGVGLRGPGETQIEIDRRLLKEQIASLKRQLEDVRRHRQLHRSNRKKLGLPIIALVGYTNAGKSTVLNHMTRAGVLAENMLFATLDPTTRRVRLPGAKVHPEVLFTDTVGFIQKLPTNLVAAFRATLEEVSEADVLVHVVDASNPSSDKQQIAVNQILKELELETKPRVTLLNKIDLCEDPEMVQLEAVELPFCVAGSAKTGVGMEDFISTLEDALSLLLRPFEAEIPYKEAQLLNMVHEFGSCEFEEYRNDGIYFMGKVPEHLYKRLEPFFVQELLDGESSQERNLNDKGEEGDEEEIDWAALAKGRHQKQE